MGEEETIELQNLVAKEISYMTNEELKSKIIKLAQAYRAERLRNEEFERALKSENMQHAYNDSAKRLAELSKEL
jgi:hypothetical protein